MAAQLILIEAQPRRAADGTTRIVRLAGGGAHYPYFYDGEHWMAGIEAAPTIITSLAYDGTDIGTGGVPQAAEITWAGASADDVADLASLVWFDAPITLRIGAEGALPPVALAGKVLAATVDGAKIKIALADPAATLKVPLLTARWGGTGGLDGPADWAGTIKPRVWGRIWNVQGKPLDAATNIYAFADPLHRLQAITAVRDKGAAASALTLLDWQGSAPATFAALQAAAAPAGGGVVCPSLACVKWWTAPAGDLTADIQGEIGAGYVETAAEIAARLVEMVSGPGFAAGAIAAAIADRPAPVGWTAVDESTTVSAMLDALLGSSSIAWVLDSAGEIVLRRWEWSAPVIAVNSHDVSRKAAYRPVATRRLGYRRNEHVQARGTLAGAVLVEDVSFADGSGLAEILHDTATAAAAAVDAASTAQAAANLANAALEDIASDNVLTPGEKSVAVLNYNVITAEHAGLDAQAGNYGIIAERTAYDDAVAALNTYLTGLTEPYLWSNITGNTNIVGADFRAAFAVVYTTRQSLLNAISAKAKLMADDATAAAIEAASAADGASTAAANAQSTAESAATTATWGGISGSESLPTGEDVASTVAVGGGVAEGQVSTPAITDNAVTEVMQAYNGASVSGVHYEFLGYDEDDNPIWSGPDYHDAITLSVTMAYPGDIIALVAAKQWYYSGGRDWKAQITINGAEVFYTEGGTGAISDSIALSGRATVAAGTHAVKFRWRSADSTLALLAGKASMVTIRRYV